MLAQLRRSVLLSSFILVASGGLWAQTTTLEGQVKGADGQPLKGAVIDLTRTDIKGHYTVKSDKKGHWLYTGLPKGTYDIQCMVDGKVADKVAGVKSDYGDPKNVDFDLQRVQAQQQAQAQAVQNGTVPQDAERGMSKEQKEQFEKAAKQRSEEMKKNKALNDAFNAGRDALQKAAADQDKTQQVADYKAAVQSFTSASTMDPNQVAVWNSLGEANYGLARAQTGDDRTKAYDDAIAAYQKSLTLKPDDAAVYNQMGNIYGAEKKMPEAEQALNKAASLDPAMAAKAFFNMGANIVNSGHPEDAAPFFKKAADADPNYAEAWYQLGSTLMMKGTVDPKTGQQAYPPETGQALQKYLQLQPTGPHAQEATAMLSAMGEKVQTDVKVPGAADSSRRKKK